MRAECLNSKWAFDEPLPVTRLVGAVSESEHAITVSVCCSSFIGCFMAHHAPTTTIRTWLWPWVLHTIELHRCTQFWGRRPFGVGLLVAGHDVSTL